MINKKNYYGHALGLPKDDERLEEYQKQREERGFDDTETWSLDSSMASFMAPRMERLLEIQRESLVEPYDGYFNDVEEVSKAFKSYGGDLHSGNSIDVINEKFTKIFPYLWW